MLLPNSIVQEIKYGKGVSLERMEMGIVSDDGREARGDGVVLEPS